MRIAAAVLGLFALCACSGDAPAPAAPGARPGPEASAGPRRDPLAGGPARALLLAQAQFVDGVAAGGTPTSIPGRAKLTIVRRGESGWTPLIIEDGESNVFHKALPWNGGILTIGGSQALLRTWRFENGQWTAATRWNPKFGGKFDRLRDVERGDVDGDGKDELVIATHDQGVIAVIHPDDGWRVEEVDRQPNTFVHEIEIGDIDGDGIAEFFATPSAPNKLDRQQTGEVRMYRHGPQGWQRSIVDAPADTHAKEILTADVDGDGVAELYVSWEGAVGPDNTLVRPVTVTQYRWKNGTAEATVVGTVPTRLMRSMAAGDCNGDGKTDLVAAPLSSGLWLFEQSPGGWTKTQIDAASSGFEHPVLLTDLDGDGALELYVASEDQRELRQYRWADGAFQKSVVMPLDKGDITWNLTDARL